MSTAKKPRNSFGKKRAEFAEIVRDERPRVLRWARLLSNLADAHSYLWIEERIKESNPPGHEWVVDHEKLQQVVNRAEDGTTRLTINQIIALDRFFSQMGEGIDQGKGLFERSILEPAANVGSVRFLLGSSVDQGELWNVVRRWDSQAMAEILRAVTQINVRVKIDIMDVIRNDAHRRREFPPRADLKKFGPSLIAIGSPLANPASEVLLSEILEVPAFGRRGNVAVPLPFQFIWPVSTVLPYQSTFAQASTEAMASKMRNVDKNHGVLQIREPIWGKKGHQLKETLLESVRLKESGDAPGVIVAQQRASGEVFMVVAGVSGPGTYAAAKYLASHRTYSLPPRIDGKHGKVLVLVVQSKVRRTSDHRGDECDVDNPEVSSSFAWPAQ